MLVPEHQSRVLFCILRLLQGHKKFLKNAKNKVSKWDIDVDRENNIGKLICAVLITMKVTGYYQQHHYMAWKHEKNAFSF